VEENDRKERKRVLNTNIEMHSQGVAKANIVRSRVPVQEERICINDINFSLLKGSSGDSNQKHSKLVLGFQQM
jgi:hypothetical protein